VDNVHTFHRAYFDNRDGMGIRSESIAECWPERPLIIRTCEEAVVVIASPLSLFFGVELIGTFSKVPSQ
jgi:hypothetical protein